MNATEFTDTEYAITSIMGHLSNLDLPGFIEKIDKLTAAGTEEPNPLRDAAEALLPAWRLAKEHRKHLESLGLVPPAP